MTAQRHESMSEQMTLREVTVVAGESITVGDDVTVTIVETVGDEVLLRVDESAQDDCPV